MDSSAGSVLRKLFQDPQWDPDLAYEFVGSEPREGGTILPMAVEAANERGPANTEQYTSASPEEDTTAVKLRSS